MCSGQLTNDFLRDQTVEGIQSDKLWPTFDRESKLDLLKCINICQADGVTQDRMESREIATINWKFNIAIASTIYVWKIRLFSSKEALLSQRSSLP